MTQFQSGNFPNELKLANITSVHKKKDPLNKDPLNHPVSVLPHVSESLKILSTNNNQLHGA